MEALIDSNTLEFATNVTQNDMKYLIKREQFLELLENRERTEAAKILRKQLSPLCNKLDSKQSDLHQLSKFVSIIRLLVVSKEEMMKISNYNGVMSGSRDVFLTKLLSI